MTLRRFLFLAASSAVLSLPAAAHAQAPNAQPDAQPDAQPGKPPDQLRLLSRDELDVVKVLTIQERAWNKGDLESYVSAYKKSPETIFVGRQISHGYDQLIADYRGNYPNKDAMGTLTFSDLEPHLLDARYAVVLGHYHLDRNKKAGGNADGIFSIVLEKTDAGWKIIVDHTT